LTPAPVPAEPGAPDLPEVMAVAAQLRDELPRLKAHLDPGFNEEYDYKGLLALGDRLGLWAFTLTISGKPRRYTVVINDRRLALLESEVPGFVIGVLLACDLPFGPFAFREGL